MLDISLFRMIAFNFIIVSILLLAMAYFTPFAFSSARAELLGVDSGKASLIISMLGEPNDNNNNNNNNSIKGYQVTMVHGVASSEGSGQGRVGIVVPNYTQGQLHSTCCVHHSDHTNISCE